MGYDITKPQPQLYVTPDIKTLSVVLEEFSETLAYKIGGEKALAKAKRAKTVTTTVLDSGLQISGTLKDYRTTKSGEISFLQFSGPCQLSFADRELEGHSAKYHNEGYSTPLGKLKGLNKCPCELTDSDFKKLDGRLEFESGVIVEGKLKSTHKELDQVVLTSFEQCTVKLGSEVS